MKLDKIKFARLIGFFERVHALNLKQSDVELIDEIIDIDVPDPEVQTVYPKNENVERLMMFMAGGTNKIDAIREHRAITGMGLKESKEAVERYWFTKYTKYELRRHWEKTPMQQGDSDAVLKFIESLS